MKRQHDHYGRTPAVTDNGPLFDTGIHWPAPSVANSASEAAADALTNTAAGRNKRERDLVTLLELIASRDSGYTRQELADESHIPLQTVCARVGYDLVPRGFVDGASTIKRDGRQVLFVMPTGRTFLAARRAA